jgi:hypothetical protein
MTDAEIDAVWNSGGEPAMQTARSMTPDQRRQALDALGPQTFGSYASRLDGPTLAQIGDLAATNRVQGIDDWVDFTAGKSGTDLDRAVGELTEARRLLNEYPGQIINIGGDGRSPPRVSNPNEQMRSFDITVEDPSGTVNRSVEVTTVDNPVSQHGDVTNGIRHAADKAADRANPPNPVDTNPIPGQHDVTIRMDLDVGTTRIGGGRQREILPDGTVRIIDADGQFRPRRGNPSNIFDSIGENLPNIGNIDQLDRVTLTDKSTGTVLAEYVKNGVTWTRVR